MNSKKKSGRSGREKKRVKKTKEWENTKEHGYLLSSVGGP